MFTTDEPTQGQRKVMLAAVDAEGRLPDGANLRVLSSIPESWARTGERGRFLTDAGRAVLAPKGRFELLEKTRPDTGDMQGVPGRGDMQALHRDGLMVFKDAEGRVASMSECWDRGVRAYITERGRKLIGMPLTAPSLSLRLPLYSQAVRRQEGQPDVPVQIQSWPFTDGTIRVRYMTRPVFGEGRVPTGELHPAPALTVPRRPEIGETKMTDRKPEVNLEDELAALRELAAAALKPMTPGSETWEQVKALEVRANAGYDLAKRFTEFDLQATEKRRAPQEWRRGKELSDEEVTALIERWPGLAALGPTFVRGLAAVGYAPFQMSNLVKRVRGHVGEN